MDVYKEISLRKLVPVVKLDNAADAEPLMAALIGGGLPVAEITFRTDAARDSIAAISGKYPEALVGAGSLTSVRQAEDAVSGIGRLQRGNSQVRAGTWYSVHAGHLYPNRTHETG